MNSSSSFRERWLDPSLKAWTAVGILSGAAGLLASWATYDGDQAGLALFFGAIVWVFGGALVGLGHGFIYSLLGAALIRRRPGNAKLAGLLATLLPLPLAVFALLRGADTIVVIVSYVVAAALGSAWAWKSSQRDP